MLRPVSWGLALALASAVPTRPQPRPQESELPALSVRVNVAITRGVRNLIAEQGEDGLWRGDETRYPGGLTAFVAYTLLKSGVRKNDPAIDRALRALADVPHRSTYGTSARLLLYQALGDAEAWRARAQPCLDSIVAFQRDRPSTDEGLWGYPEDPIDFSNLQFALLGLRAASDMGLRIPERTLVEVSKAMWRSVDERTGGFRYRPDTPATGGITAAALGCHELLQAFAADYPAIKKALAKNKKDLARATEFLIERWDPARNAWGHRAWTPSFEHCYLWAVQRWCELTGAERIGEHDWYAEGAEHLVATQNDNGSWGSQRQDTCFALLFLRRTTFSGGKELAELYDDAAVVASARPRSLALAGDPPWTTTCLAAGPFAGEAGKGGDSGLLDPPFDARKLRVREGDKVTRKERATWERLELNPKDWTDLERATGRGGDMCLWLVATEILVAGEDGDEGAEPRDVVLWLALEDGHRVLVDGEQVAFSERVQAPIRPEIPVPVRLAPGVHELLVVVEDAKGSAAFGLRLSGADGEPIAGVTAGIDGARKR